jgi:hypothetical protein
MNPFLSQTNSVHTFTPYLIILSPNLRLCLPIGLFSSGFLAKMLYAFLISHLTLLDVTTLIIYVKSINYETPHYAVASHNFLSL